MIISPQYPALKLLVDRQIASYPRHADYLGKRFRDEAEDHMIFCNDLAELISKLIYRDPQPAFQGYDFLTKIVIEEEIYFRRNGTYRLKSFEQADREIYSDPVYMANYMNGLLMSQLWWRNHSEVMQYYQQSYLNTTPYHSDHLEIGPGHGLFLYLAATHPRTASATGWDISKASIDLVKEAMHALGYGGSLNLECVNMFAAPQRQFHSIAFSEVLEHLEEPEKGLSAVFAALHPGGRAFINAPVNSPAPDHLKLFSHPDEIFRMIEDAGFVIVDKFCSPATGASIERAQKLKLAISTAVIAERPA